MNEPSMKCHNLRDRIAAVICDMDALHAKQWSLDVADAVIRELGLQAQHLDRASCVGNKPAIRYVTEWQPDRLTGDGQ